MTVSAGESVEHSSYRFAQRHFCLQGALNRARSRPLLQQANRRSARLQSLMGRILLHLQSGDKLGRSDSCSRPDNDTQSRVMG